MLFPEGMTTKSDKTLLVNAEAQKEKRRLVKLLLAKLENAHHQSSTQNAARVLRHVSIMSHDTTTAGKLNHNLQEHADSLQPGLLSICHHDVLQIS